MTQQNSLMIFSYVNLSFAFLHARNFYLIVICTLEILFGSSGLFLVIILPSLHTLLKLRGVIFLCFM